MSPRRLSNAVLVIVTSLLASFTRGQPPVAPTGKELNNADFSASAVGEAPVGWTVTSTGFKAVVVADERTPNKRAVELRPPWSSGKDAWGNIMQSIDATPFRGKRVVFRAQVRQVFPLLSTNASEEAYSTQLWLRVDRAGKKQGYFDNMDDRRIRGERARAFQFYSVSGLVDDDAVSINFGLITFGGATARLASVQVYAVDPNEKGDRPAAPLVGRGLVNLTALARLYGYVRFFHPSDQAAGVDWDIFPIAAIESVEAAASPEELAAALQKVFEPIAPTLQIWAGSTDVAPPAPSKPDDAPKFRVWRHNGCGLAEGSMNIYSSRREAWLVESPGAGRPAAGTSVVKDLGGGVCCRVPICVWADGQGRTLPVLAKSPELLGDSRPDWWVPSGGDRATRLADVINAWNIFQHFYPYFDVSRTDWPGVLAGALESAALDADESAFTRTLQRLVAQLHDGHGGVYRAGTMPAASPNMSLDWAQDAQHNPALVVVAVGPDCPIIHVGDQILAINGKSIDQVYREALPCISAATDQWARYRFAIDPGFVAPGADDQVSYTVRRGSEELSVSVSRHKPGTRRAREQHPANGSELAPGIVYFDLNAAQDSTLQAAMPALKAAKGIVFDARGYPGSAGQTLLRHLTDEPIQSAYWIVPLVTLPDQDKGGFELRESGRWNLVPLLPRLGADGQKVAFVTGGGAISYAESCMGIVEAYKLGEIVGGPTAGTNGNVNPFALPGGFNLSWTGMQVLKHDHSRHHGVGIQPTVPVRRTVEGIAAGKDEALEAAVKKVSE